MSVEIEIDTTQYDQVMPRVITGSEQLGAKAIFRSVVYVDEKFGHNIPVRTGKLKNTRVRTIEPTRGQIRTTAGYGKFVDEGTGPHIIKGNPLLRFKINGRTFFRRQVQHPGIKPRKFKDKTLIESRDGIFGILREIINEAIA